MLALSPIIVFLVVYLAASIVARDFYAMPISVSFVIASVYSVAVLRGKKLEKRVEIFSRGAMDSTTMLMFWIFILAGAFAETAKQMGAVDSMVGIMLQMLPNQVVPASMFIASCFVSMSIGTSVGTIVTLTPIAASMSAATGISLPVMCGVIVGGAYFGDNLSFISDTTIIATTSQNCKLNDKFKVNIYLAFPAAIATTLIYIFMGLGYSAAGSIPESNILKVIPYLAVIMAAIFGMNVLAVLALGLVLTFLIGVLTGSYSVLEFVKAAGDGIIGMGELIIIVLLASGIVGVIKHLGGIDYLVKKILFYAKSKRASEFAIFSIICLVNICTANNTVTLITISNIVKKISQRYHIDPRRAASLMDTSSCFIQGVLPYGAQMLMVSALAKINPLEVLPHVYYLFALLAMTLFSIITQYPKRYARRVQ